MRNVALLMTAVFVGFGICSTPAVSLNLDGCEYGGTGEYNLPPASEHLMEALETANAISNLLRGVKNFSFEKSDTPGGPALDIALNLVADNVDLDVLETTLMVIDTALRTKDVVATISDEDVENMSEALICLNEYISKAIESTDSLPQLIDYIGRKTVQLGARVYLETTITSKEIDGKETIGGKALAWWIKPDLSIYDYNPQDPEKTRRDLANAGSKERLIEMIRVATFVSSHPRGIIGIDPSVDLEPLTPYIEKLFYAKDN